jgi:hypothetical protein
MKHEVRPVPAEIVETDWAPFPGGELEAPRSKAQRALCPACRETLRREVLNSRSRPSRPSSPSRPLCFQCYRADLARERALKAAGQLNTASEERFQSQLPLEPVNIARLATLKTERAEARVASSRGIGQYVDKRRQAQIAARHALQAIAEGLKARQIPAAAIHAAELQLPDAWLPFVVSR